MIKKFLDELGIKPSKKIMTTLSSPDSIAHQYIFEIVPADKNVKIDRMNEKPIYVVRGFLRSIEEDHEKFKRDEIKYIKSVEEELKVIKSSLAYKIYEKERT